MRNPRNDAAERLDHSPERTCVLTRRKGRRDSLIRLALGPDGTVAPDVRARAPGRGAWISVSKNELQEAISNGKLKASCSARSRRVTCLSLPTLHSEPRTRFGNRRSIALGWRLAPAI